MNGISNSVAKTRSEQTLRNLVTSPRSVATSGTGSRSFEADSQLDRFRAAAARHGMTELRDITAAGRAGIPIFQAKCAGTDEGLISEFSGKGIDPRQSVLSACGEVVERTSASPQHCELISGTYNELSANNTVLHPESLVVHRLDIPASDRQLRWTWAQNLCTGEPTLVPAVSVFHPYQDAGPPLFTNQSTGLAAGASLLEAAIQAFYEVIERDANSLAQAARLCTSVPTQSIKIPTLRRVLETFSSAGVSVSVKETTTDVGVPCYAVYGDDKEEKNSHFLNAGYGCHANKTIALTRAVAELAQSRAVIRQGTREDLRHICPGDGSDYETLRNDWREWFENTEPICDFELLPCFEFTDLWEELQWVLSRVDSSCTSGPYIVDLTRDEGVPVVRVIAPGLESYCVDRRRIGRRALDAFRLGRRAKSMSASAQPTCTRDS